MSESSSFNEQKRAVVNENTALSLMSGLAIRYHKALEVYVGKMERLAATTLEADAQWLNSGIIPKMQLAMNAEAALGFSLLPSNMAVCVNVMKLDPKTGCEIVFSDINVGLIGGLAEDGQPSNGFVSEDLDLAVQRLREQKQAGLVYGLPTSAGFIPNY